MQSLNLADHVQSHDGLVGDGYLRHALYYPLVGEHKAERKGVRMYGLASSANPLFLSAASLTSPSRHTDYGTTTLLFSVPVTALQIWKDERWRFIKYKPGALVVNLGETLEGS